MNIAHLWLINAIYSEVLYAAQHVHYLHRALDRRLESDV